jgi:putative membrane protein
MKDFLKTGYAKATAAVLAGALVVGTAFGSGIFNDNTPMKASADATKKTETQKTVEKEYPSLLQSNGSAAVDKSETTYVVMDSDGSQKEVVTEEQLTNKNDEDSLEDRSTLSDIENTSGDQKFVQDGDSLTWDAKGKPITYKGTPTSDLPVTVNITYYLDGEKMSAEDIAGKSGNVKIRFDYDVNAKDLVDGYSLTHPFTMASGVVLDDEHFSDVSVSNGKAINDGSKTVVLGVAFPGMNSNLGINTSTFSIPDSVVVSAYTDDFEFDGTYTIALSGLLNGTDTSKLDDAESGVEALESSLDELADASNQLTEGAAELSDGAKTLKDGTSSLKDGTSSLKSGTDTLRSGSAKELAGMEDLDSGLQKLSAQSETLRKATSQIEDTVFETATTAYQEATNDKDTTLTPENYIQVINNVSKSAVSTAEKQLRAQLKTSGVTDTSTQDAILSLAWTELAADGNTSPSTAEITSAITSAAGKAQKAQIVSQGYEKYKDAVVQYLLKAGKTEEEIESNPAQVYVLTTILALNNGDTSKLNDTTAVKTATEYVQAANEYSNASKNASENVTKLASAAVSGSGATEKLSELKSQLDSIEQYVAGVNQYTAGVDTAAAGSSKLVSGMKQINSGIKSLDSGASQLDSGASKLDKGAGTLSDGADTLADSMSKFNEEGIQAFVSTLDDAQIADMTGKLKASIDASKKEVFVGGKLSSMTGESRIIFKTGEVKKDK